MNVVRSLWASIQGDPVFMRRVNGWLTVFWLVMIPVSLITGWISSVTYVAALSLWALVSGHWSAWQAARVEVRQDEEAARAEAEPVEERAVDKLVDETTVGTHRRSVAHGELRESSVSPSAPCGSAYRRICHSIRADGGAIAVTDLCRTRHYLRACEAASSELLTFVLVENGEPGASLGPDNPVV